MGHATVAVEVAGAQAGVDRLQAGDAEAVGRIGEVEQRVGAVAVEVGEAGSVGRLAVVREHQQLAGRGPCDHVVEAAVGVETQPVDLHDGRGILARRHGDGRAAQEPGARHRPGPLSGRRGLHPQHAAVPVLGEQVEDARRLVAHGGFVQQHIAGRAPGEVADQDLQGRLVAGGGVELDVLPGALCRELGGHHRGHEEAGGDGSHGGTVGSEERLRSRANGGRTNGRGHRQPTTSPGYGHMARERRPSASNADRVPPTLSNHRRA
jgi:hypothetical protein